MTDFVLPDWPAPSNVRALQTTRSGGVSQGAYGDLNLGDHVGDDPAAVASNRQWLCQSVNGSVLWLNQVHGTAVVESSVALHGVVADAAIARCSGEVCAVMTADCLPVLFCNRAGTVVAAAHAGWRGLCAGILEQTVFQMGCSPADLLVWLGPAIGPSAFEVGDEVRTAFVAVDAAAVAAFVPGSSGRWLADIFLLARQRLMRLGIDAVYGGGVCTVADSERFFSYRRDGQTGRMATLIWLDAAVERAEKGV